MNSTRRDRVKYKHFLTVIFNSTNRISKIKILSWRSVDKKKGYFSQIFTRFRNDADRSRVFPPPATFWELRYLRSYTSRKLSLR